MIGRQCGIALDDADICKRHIEFFGGDLSERDTDAGAEIDLADINRDHALAIDRQESIDLVESDRFRGRQRLRKRVRWGCYGEGDNESASSFEKVAA